jgi:hypothetical protein
VVVVVDIDGDGDVEVVATVDAKCSVRRENESRRDEAAADCDPMAPVDRGASGHAADATRSGPGYFASS